MTTCSCSASRNWRNPQHSCRENGFYSSFRDSFRLEPWTRSASTTFHIKAFLYNSLHNLLGRTMGHPNSHWFRWAQIWIALNSRACCSKAMKTRITKPTFHKTHSCTCITASVRIAHRLNQSIPPRRSRLNHPTLGPFQYSQVHRLESWLLVTGMQNGYPIVFLQSIQQLQRVKCNQQHSCCQISES